MTRIEPLPVPSTWNAEICVHLSWESCLAAQSWHWLRRYEIDIDPALSTMGWLGFSYGVALVATRVVGEQAGLRFVLTVSSAGIRASEIVLLGSVTAVIVGTLFGAATALLTSATPLGDYYDDKPDLSYCRALHLEQYSSTPDGAARLLALTPAELLRLAPCLPKDSNIIDFLKTSAVKGQEAEKQLLPRP